MCIKVYYHVLTKLYIYSSRANYNICKFFFAISTLDIHIYLHNIYTNLYMEFCVCVWGGVLFFRFSEVVKKNLKTPELQGNIYFSTAWILVSQGLVYAVAILCLDWTTEVRPARYDVVELLTGTFSGSPVTVAMQTIAPGQSLENVKTGLTFALPPLMVGIWGVKWVPALLNRSF